MTCNRRLVALVTTALVVLAAACRGSDGEEALPEAFLFTVNYPASIFLLVDDLSEWSPYSEERIRSAWTDMFPPSEGDRKILAEYAKVRRSVLEEHDWGYFEQCLADTLDLGAAFSCLESRLSDRQLEAVRQAVQLVRGDFDELWKLHVHPLEEKRNALTRLARTLELNHLKQRLCRFYRAPCSPDPDVIHLLFDPSAIDGFSGSDGGANGILFLRSGPGRERSEDLWIALHEWTHSISDSLVSELLGLVEAEGLERGRSIAVLHEAIDYALFPGYYHEKVLNTPYDFVAAAGRSGEGTHGHDINTLAGDIYPEVRSLVEEGKPADGDFLQHLVQRYMALIH